VTVRSDRLREELPQVTVLPAEVIAGVDRDARAPTESETADLTIEPWQIIDVDEQVQGPVREVVGARS
jgi:hypothetical protein